MFNFGSIAALVAGIFVVVTVLKSVRLVGQSQALVIERLGKYNRTLSSGLFLLIPFIDRVASKFSLQEQRIDIPPQNVYTSDNVSIRVDGVVYLRIQDPKKATYEILNVRESLASLAQTTLRGQIGTMELEDTNSKREELNAALLAALDEASNGWGSKVTRVELSEIKVPKNIQEAMDLQITANRQRRAVETEAQGEKNAAIEKAEGEKQAAIAKAEGERQATFYEAEARERMAAAEKVEKVLQAEGQQESLTLIAEAINENPLSAEFTLNQERIAAFSKLAGSDSANKMIVPTESAELFGLVKSFGHLVGQKAQ